MTCVKYLLLFFKERTIAKFWTILLAALCIMLILAAIVSGIFFASRKF